MKKILLLFLMLPALSGAQIVNFPDANFKARLLAAGPENSIAWGNGGYVKIDSNGDSEIQLAEAAAIDSLDVSFASISSMTGISSFSNLKKLDCYGNSLYALDLTGLNLKRLHCADNSIATLDVSGMTNLEFLDCTGNNIALLTLDALPNLQYLVCQSNQLSALNVQNCPQLKQLVCSGNNLTTLDLSGLSELTYADANYNNLTAINLSGINQIRHLNLRENQFTSLIIANYPYLEYFYCDDNLITTLVTENLPSLLELHAGRNPYTSIDVSTLANLKVIQVNGTALTALDVSGLEDLLTINADANFPAPGMLTSLVIDGCVSLQAIYAESNQLTTIDASTCQSLIYLSAYDNNLETVFIKNGSVEDIYVAGNPNLAYICADDFQIEQIENWLSQYNINGVVCNSYCSFNPGAPYNTVNGVARLDADNTGCDAVDPWMPSVRIDINDGTTSGATFTNTFGEYSFFVQQPNVTLVPSMENPSYFNITPTSETVTFSDNGYHTESRDFCVTANGVHPDLEIVIIPLVPARPGFNAEYTIICKNKGNQVLSGSVVFIYEDDVLDFVSSSVAPDVQTLGQLEWSYTGMAPFAVQTYHVTLNVNSPVETPAVNIGDELNFAVIISPIEGDETPSDNTFGLKQTVVGSFDPNDKHCMQGEVVSTTQIGNFLHYVINFENTGNFPAENVVIKDLLDADKFDISSLQVLSSSHAEVPVLTGNKLEFYFEGINLVPNEYGYVAYKIKTKPTLTAGSVVTNKASIFFDFNAPVVTNTATTTFQQLGVPRYNTASVKLFPNPVRSVLHIEADNPIQSVSVLDSQGRMVWSGDNRETSATSHERDIDLQLLSSGVFFLRTVTEHGTCVDKIIKE